MTAVCIAGMSRSGTSMVTRMLHLAGLCLGDSRSLREAISSNVEGQWEHEGFLALNNSLLAHWGAGWDFPPRIPIDLRDPGLDPLRRRARDLIQEFHGQAAWGWKDPRSCLTLPFWLDMVDGLKVVVPVRNPIEVAQSLKKRNASSVAFSMHLWHRYYGTVLESCPSSRRLVVHYDSCLADPNRELERMLRFVDLPAPPDRVRIATSSVRPGLRHSRYSIDDLSKSGVDERIVRMYGKLCREDAQLATTADGAELRVFEHEPGVDELRNEPGLDLPDDRSWWRRRVGHPMRMALLQLVGADWVIRSQEDQLWDLRHQLSERISWEQQLERRVDRTSSDT